MEATMAATCLHWSQPITPPSSPPSKALSSIISSPPSRKRRSYVNGGVFFCKCVPWLNQSALFGTSSRNPKPRNSTFKIRPSSLASFNDDAAFSDEEFSKQILELVRKSQLNSESQSVSSGQSFQIDYNLGLFDAIDLPWPGIINGPPMGDEIIVRADIERKANSMDLPLSLRIIKKKMQWKQGVKEAGESAYCSVEKAFSSMVFMIRELHSYSLQLREILFFEDLNGILGRVQQEMHASFVWLFQQVFSRTPTLMVYIMILLANFTVYSMSHNAAIAAASYPPTTEGTTASSVLESQDQKHKFINPSAIKTFSFSSSSGKTASIGGDNGGGGGGKARPVASSTDGEDWSDRSDQYRGIRSVEKEEVSLEEEFGVWDSMVEEAHKMEGVCRADFPSSQFISPVTVNMEQDDDYKEYLGTELIYQTGLSQEPNNPLLLANYAQFLYLVARDFDRAEEYFKRAVEAKPTDAEAYNKYATFLWRVREDLWAAEETFLEAISAEPSNSYYAANYANFLWNTGGEDTCFPLTTSDRTAS